MNRYFNFSNPIDLYSNKIVYIILEIYIALLLYSSILSFFPFYQAEAANFTILLIANISFILTSFIIFINLLYKILTESINVNTNLIFIFFFILLEFLAHFIRLISITLRISANTISGHILVSMVSTIFYICINKIMSLKLILITLFLLLFYFFFLSLEIVVSLIQIYVIILLILFYLIENE